MSLLTRDPSFTRLRPTWTARGDCAAAVYRPFARGAVSRHTDGLLRVVDWGFVREAALPSFLPSFRPRPSSPLLASRTIITPAVEGRRRRRRRRASCLARPRPLGGCDGALAHLSGSSSSSSSPGRGGGSQPSFWQGTTAAPPPPVLLSRAGELCAAVL